MATSFYLIFKIRGRNKWPQRRNSKMSCTCYFLVLSCFRTHFDLTYQEIKNLLYFREHTNMERMISFQNIEGTFFGQGQHAEAVFDACEHPPSNYMMYKSEIRMPQKELS